MLTDQRPTQTMNPFTFEAWTGVRPAWERPWWELAERALGLKRLATVYASLVHKMLTPEAFAEAVLNGLQVNWSESPEFGIELRRLKGPVLVVANHPFGAIEALWIMCWLGRSGRDYRVLANDWLGALPELRSRLLCVNVLHRDTDARQANTRAMRQASIWLKQGGMLVVFPAGEVAHLSWGGIRAVEGPWSHHIIRLALQYNATVLPVHFPGQNSAVFHVLGLLHPRLRTLYLAREAARPGHQLRVAVGAPLALNDLATLAPPDQLAPALRAHTLRLIPETPATVAGSPHATLDLLPPTEILVREVMSLSARGRVLVSEGRLCVLWFRAIEAPALMRAVAVGRERAFRDVGEGSGKSRDEDVFDRDYTQIVLWDAEAQAVAGAYRAVVASGRWHKQGADGLYTTTLFHMSQNLASELDDALELGRSYVGGPWQRQALPLMLLWRGVGGLRAPPRPLQAPGRLCQHLSGVSYTYPAAHSPFSFGPRRRGGTNRYGAAL